MRRSIEEEHVNHERWLISYADFITLLFAFFVVMYSISQVNEGKYRVLSETLSDTFKTDDNGLASETGDQVPVDSEEFFSVVKGAVEGLEGGRRIDGDPDQMGSGGLHQGHVDPLDDVQNMLMSSYQQQIDDELISVKEDNDWLELELKSNVLFNSGSARPSRQAEKIFDEMAIILRGYPNLIRVEGHTDNRPTSGARFSSNWQLSAARAASVVELLVKGGVRAMRLSAVGHGENQPVADNTTVTGRAQNRRVLIRLAKKQTLSTLMLQEDLHRSLLDEVSDDQVQTIPPRSRQQLQSVGWEDELQWGDLDQQEPVAAGQESEKVEAVELEGGGLLFTRKK